MGRGMEKAPCFPLLSFICGAWLFQALLIEFF